MHSPFTIKSTKMGTNQTKITAGIVGGTGLTAGELLRILLNHPLVEVGFITSTSMQNHSVHEVHRDLLGETELKFQEMITPCDVVFLCLPHGESKAWMKENAPLLTPTTRIIDLGNDFRVDELWEGRRFVYGLSEFFREEIKNATYIANPGCFATALQLGMLPLLKISQVESFHAVGITGATGAGKALHQTTNFLWRSSNISPYKTFSHQHQHEIRHTTRKLYQKDVPLHFVPWRGGFTRGIMVSLMASTPVSLSEIQEEFSAAYRDSSFVHVVESPLDLKQVVGTNKAVLQLEKVGEELAVHVVLDNLLKGACGQAVQNMNLMMGLSEREGLSLKAHAF